MLALAKLLPDDDTTPNNEVRIGFGDMATSISPLKYLSPEALESIKDILNKQGTCICTANPVIKLCGNSKKIGMMPGGDATLTTISTIPENIEQQEQREEGDEGYGPTMTDADISDISLPPHCCDLVDGKVIWDGILAIKFIHKFEAKVPITGGVGKVDFEFEFDIKLTPSIANEFKIPYCDPPIWCKCSEYYITPQVKIEGSVAVKASISYTIPIVNIEIGTTTATQISLTSNVVFDQVKLTCPTLPEDDGKPKPEPK